MNRSYWQTYVQETDGDEIERHPQRTGFPSSGQSFELIYFEETRQYPFGHIVFIHRMPSLPELL